MSILIKGMGMPESCEDCSAQIIDPTGGASGCAVNHSIILQKRGEGRPATCPLVEIPPHGRLIDADRLGRWMCRHKNGKAKTCDRCEAYWNGNNINTNCSEVKLWALRLINDMPTVIEAEGRE